MPLIAIFNGELFSLVLFWGADAHLNSLKLRIDQAVPCPLGQYGSTAVSQTAFLL